MPKITSWISKADGSLVESDLKFFPSSDGTYIIQTTQESIGFVLGSDSSNRYTIILKLLDEKRYVRKTYVLLMSTFRIEKFKASIAVGDVLVSINERSVLDEPFENIAVTLESLMYDICSFIFGEDFAENNAVQGNSSS